MGYNKEYEVELQIFLLHSDDRLPHVHTWQCYIVAMYIATRNIL